MSTRIPGKMGTKALTEAMRKLSAEAITITDSGDPVTRAQQLADLVWKFALGWTERRVNPNSGRMEEVFHPPVAWAIQWITERLEGKAPIAPQEDNVGIKAADKVRQLSVDRINKLAKVGAKPPSYKPKGD